MKIRKLLLSFLVLGSLVSCGSAAVSGTNSSSNNSENIAVSSLEEMCSYLESKEVLSGERREMSASVIGAVEGTKYIDYEVEIYLFANDAPKSFTVFGINMDFDATNGKYALSFSSGANKKQNIIDEFNNVKTK